MHWKRLRLLELVLTSKAARLRSVMPLTARRIPCPTPQAADQLHGAATGGACGRTRLDGTARYEAPGVKQAVAKSLKRQPTGQKRMVQVAGAHSCPAFPCRERRAAGVGRGGAVRSHPPGIG